MKCPIFPFSESKRKNGAFEKNEQKNWGISEKKHVINFNTENESKIKLLDISLVDQVGFIPAHANIKRSKSSIV